MSDRVLHAWLISDEDEGAAFLDDIWCMLTHIAERDGCSLERTATSALTDSDTSRIAVMNGIPSKLLSEIGVHRAQRIPAGSTTGRIATSLVDVEMLPLDAPLTTGRPKTEILKTYNYIERFVVQHTTGNRGSLAQGLEGDI